MKKSNRKNKGGRISAGVQTLETMTPKQIFEHLDRYIVGQKKAKRALAVAPASGPDG